MTPVVSEEFARGFWSARVKLSDDLEFVAWTKERLRTWSNLSDFMRDWASDPS
ncbi:hypothetical protein SEA_ESTES_46 [Mycobacterium phage Estes]|uniref:Uncharacterized protein n=1 Tax=Mycobacterium phage Estes TaxID=2759459 RepID=A0A7G9A2B6_9CAUD|nr:hypothetical protein J4U03_gp046 [Mycobacterium phage Estes]QNL30755.1 hypothetical protein SEA_ESTES_46 [Mycobacterium phage Estes]